MAECSMAVVLKTTVPGRVPGVRIPLSPPTFAKRSLRSRLRLAGQASPQALATLRLRVSLRRTGSPLRLAGQASPKRAHVGLLPGGASGTRVSVGSAYAFRYGGQVAASVGRPTFDTQTKLSKRSL